MNLNLRQEQILELVQTAGEWRVAELKDRFGVTEMTIRRDLEKLEQLGSVRRTFGGVMWVGKDVALHVRSGVMQAEKLRIGKKAAACIQPGESIFIDGGSTTLQVARSLEPGMGITVVTNALNVAHELQQKQISVMVAGGVLREATSSLVGPIASQVLSSMMFDRVFLGASGLTPEHGFSNTNQYEVEIKRLVIKQAKRAYVVMDHSKFGKQFLFSFAEIGQIHGLFTDLKPDGDHLRLYIDAGLKVIACSK